MEFVHLNSPKTGYLDPLFHTFTDLMNRTGAQQNTDWFVSTCNIIFSLTIC